MHSGRKTAAGLILALMLLSATAAYADTHTKGISDSATVGVAGDLSPYQFAGAASLTVAVAGDLETLQFVGMPELAVSITGAASPDQFTGVGTLTVATTGELVNVAPVNGAFSVTDMTDADNIYAQLQDYTISTSTSDVNTYSDITTVDLTFKTSAGATIGTIRYTEDTDTFSIFTGTNNFALGTGSVAVRSGSDITLTYKFRLLWGYAGAAACTLEMVTTDTDGLTDTDSTTAYCDLITRLITQDFASNVTSIQVSQPVLLSGKVRYANTPTGNIPSSSYPPNAEFTNVQIWSADAGSVATDSTIVNGAFSMAFTITTVKPHVYFVYIAMADADYADGLAPDGDYVTITTTSVFFLTPIIEGAANYFNVPDFIVSFLDMMSHLVAYYAQCITLIINGITMVFLVIIGVGTFVFDWLFRILTTMAAITAEVLAIFNGTSTAATGLGNIWTLLSLTTASTLSFVTYLVILLWLESIDIREKRQGGGWTAIMVGDVQIVTYVVGIIFEYSWMIFNFVFNAIINLSGLIPGASP